MSMAGYTKLFSSIITSTIWREPKETKVLWITMLALADKDGFVDGTVPGLAAMANLSIDETLLALEHLLGPDKFSRTQENEGRRIEAREGGWHLINHSKYRELLGKDERRAYMRTHMRQRRSKQALANVNSELAPLAQAEAATEAKAEASKDVGKSKSASASSTTDEDWLKSLEANEAYAGIDVRREFGKMTAWCQTNRKEATRRRFVNWLNRCDKPLVKGGSNGRAEW